jgi:3-dehydroquinate synthase
MKSTLTYLKKLELYKQLENFSDGEFFAIIDQKLKNHLPQWITFSTNIFWLKEPERDKNLETFGAAVNFFLQQGIHRQSTLYAFGGGATTDLAGFVAATILRGINWVAVPTTLLAMIDGSIGGKVALNMPQGKNLVGAFHMPKEVFICGDFLTSLPENEWLSGKGEMLKYGFLSKEIYDLIVRNAPIEEIAHACAQFKTEVVEKDFTEQGERIHLNLGHTLGHAFESLLKIPHGYAVGMGLKYIFKILENTSALESWDLLARHLGLPVEKFSLEQFPEFDVRSFVSYLDQDKKKIDQMIRLVLVKEIGSCYVEEASLKDFKSKIISHAEFIR